jgi:hypothetical protein
MVPTESCRPVGTESIVSPTVWGLMFTLEDPVFPSESVTVSWISR